MRGCRLMWTSAVAVGLTVFMGCGGSVPPEPKATTGNVHGKVAHKGQPVTEGQVVFTNKSLKTDVAGTLGADGTYKATNLAVGDYSVSVIPTPVAPSMEAGKPTPPPNDPANIPKKYRSKDSSGLETSIKKGDNSFDIDMQD